jgi:hypothetical protein
VVVDTSSGSLAHAETEGLTVERVTRVPAGAGTAGLALGADDAIFVGAGRNVTAVDGGSGAVAGRWAVSADVRGLGISRDGSRVYLGGADEVVWYDAATGGVLGRAPMAGLSTVRYIR